ncbi:MAG: ABC transporter substrate-binding protein [Deltaproteobacteria bacterium]|nr:ABC transporter substrate-binding protein [Deltaproteobacteria bacterium]
MKKTVRSLTCFVALLFIWSIVAFQPADLFAAKPAKTEKTVKTEAVRGSMAEKHPNPNAAYDVSKMGDVSDFDPATYVAPKGDTIKIGYINCFSGPGAINGQIHALPLMYAAHDINRRGGILVDGKKKLIEVIIGDHQSKADVAKKVAERLVLQDKVHVLVGTSGSNLMKIISNVAEKYKVIAVNNGSLADDLMNATNFNRYTFMVSPGTDQIGRGLAYYYGQIRKKEKKFYIICQDYSFGRAMAASFKQGLKDYYPEAQVVGEDYHKLFLTDFAPYLTKIGASGAEVVYTGDWVPDSVTLLKQMRQMGIKLPVANLFMNEPNGLIEIGVEGTKGLVHIDVYDMPYPFKHHPPFIKFYKTWVNQWKKWTTLPYKSSLFEIGATTSIALYGQTGYWLFSVIERAGSTDPEKIIKVWEGDTYRYANGSIVKMRACDHRSIQDFSVTEFVPPEQQKVSMTIPPYSWYKGCSFTGPAWLIPAGKILPYMDQQLDRCKGKSDWGE